MGKFFYFIFISMPYIFLFFPLFGLFSLVDPPNLLYSRLHLFTYEYIFVFYFVFKFQFIYTYMFFGRKVSVRFWVL